MELNILTETQAQEYIASLDLNPGSEAHKTIGIMMLLPAESFIRAISAIAQGLISFHAIRSLPAMNERMVDGLINAVLGQSSITTLAYKYRTSWFPNSIDEPAFKKTVLGNVKDVISTKFVDRWGDVIRPKYDFTGVDENQYHTYAEAYIAYMSIANTIEIAELIANFEDYHNTIVEEYPQLFEDDQMEILKVVKSLAKQPLFLERANGNGRQTIPRLEWLLSGSWRQVEPRNYKRFMEKHAFVSMAESEDPIRSCIPGVAKCYTDNPWEVINGSDIGWDIDRMRMARVFLPSLFPNEFSINDDLDIATALTTYFSVAYTTVRNIHEIIRERMSRSAVGYRQQSGSPIGLLLAITFTR